MYPFLIRSVDLEPWMVFTFETLPEEYDRLILIHTQEESCYCIEFPTILLTKWQLLFGCL